MTSYCRKHMTNRNNFHRLHILTYSPIICIRPTSEAVSGPYGRMGNGLCL